MDEREKYCIVGRENQARGRRMVGYKVPHCVAKEGDARVEAIERVDWVQVSQCTAV